MKKSITTLDLNLLLCLQLLMQERSVTKAAKRMNVTPSAVSKSLAKLRAWFDDPLFVNSPRGLKFELAAESPLMMIMLNALSKRIYQRYPQATIKLRNWDYDSLDAITRGEVDIGFSGRESHPRSRELLSSLPLAIDYEVLFSDVPCVWLRKDHPALHETWNLDTFLRYPHISICWEQSDTWALDNVLQELGRERTIAMSLPEFEQSLFMAAQPDNLLLATAPRYCQYYNQLHQLPLVALPLPFDESQQKKLEVPFTLLWHKRNSHNPKIVWLRETIKNLYASMA
ncbi:HTH-type transcriptional regulator YidZ [Escherichia coli]